MKFVQKTAVSVTALALALFILTSCANANADFDALKKARDLYAGLNSAYITVTDLETKKLTSQFVFRYEGDLLTYYYMNTLNGTIYYEHHNGYKLSFGDYGDSGWTEKESGDSSYHSYTKNKKHPFTDRDFIFFDERNVSSVSLINYAGSVQIDCEYDVSAIDLDKIKRFFSFEKLIKLTVKIIVNKNGYAERILITGNADGELYNIQTDIKTINNVSVIERHPFP